MPRRCRGFTLLELMIVLVLIGVLLAIVSFASGSSPARQARQEAHAFAGLIRQLREQIGATNNTISEQGKRLVALNAQQAFGAVAVDQVGQQRLALGGVAGGDAAQARDQRRLVAREQARKRRHVGGGQRLALEQALGQRGEFKVAARFGAERVEVGVARGVEQAQAREVPAQAKLFRRGREQQQARRARRQRFNQGITRAGEFGGPDQVVGFVHQQQVPAGGQGLAQFTSVLRFASTEQLQTWLDSEDRRSLVEIARPMLADGDQTEINADREFWFTPVEAGATPPPRWKQACVTFLVIMPLSLIVPQLWQPIFEHIAWLGSYPVSAVVVTLTIVLLVVYFFMPMMTRWLAGWLNPSRREE